MFVLWVWVVVVVVVVVVAGGENPIDDKPARMRVLVLMVPLQRMGACVADGTRIRKVSAQLVVASRVAIVP